MSVAHLTRAFALPPEVHGSARLVALALADAAGIETDECWPSIPKIMRQAGIKQSKSLKTAFNQLIDLGLLEIVEQGAVMSLARPDKRTNLYRLCGDLAVARREPSKGRLLAPRTADGGVVPTLPRGDTSRRRGGVVRAANGGVATTPQTVSKEPCIEPKTTTALADERDDAVRRAAIRLVDEWWEWRRDRGEVPVQPYIAVLKIVDRALRQGVEIHDMKRALRDTATVTGAALEFALSKARGKIGRAAPNLSDEAVESLMVDYGKNRPANGTGSPLPLAP